MSWSDTHISFYSYKTFLQTDKFLLLQVKNHMPINCVVPSPKHVKACHSLSSSTPLSRDHRTVSVWKTCTSFVCYIQTFVLLRCDTGYKGAQCDEPLDFNILYVVPSRQKLRYVLIAAFIGAVQIAIIVAVVMCITR